MASIEFDYKTYPTAKSALAKIELARLLIVCCNFMHIYLGLEMIAIK